MIAAHLTAKDIGCTIIVLLKDATIKGTLHQLHHNDAFDMTELRVGTFPLAVPDDQEIRVVGLLERIVTEPDTMRRRVLLDQYLAPLDEPVEATQIQGIENLFSLLSDAMGRD